MDRQSKLKNNQILSVVVLGAIIFFVFILPMIEKRYSEEENRMTEGLTNIGDENKIDTNLCSRQCCKHTQWPVDHNLHEKNIPEEQLKNYVPTNFSCNFGSGSGCLCVSKEQYNYLSNRGTNAGHTSNLCPSNV